MSEDELYLTPAPFYVHETFRRFCSPEGDCDFCCFAADEDDWESDIDAGRVCPDNLWWYNMQRQKVRQKFDDSHPPICPYCDARMVADGTITLRDEDVAAFTCKCCRKIERSSRFCIEFDRRRKKSGGGQ